MPELPEVEAIARVARRHSPGRVLERIEVVRWNGKYFASPDDPWPGLAPSSQEFTGTFRVGKMVLFRLQHVTDGVLTYLTVHNAMTGYFDWQHDPWTFDYVEGARDSNDSDVRVRLHLGDGSVLRFHDVRLFGSMRLSASPPTTGPELMATDMMLPGLRVISLAEFSAGVLRERRPIKALLLDQSFVAGVGNIYANEGCHLAGIDPRLSAREVGAERISILLEALRCVVLQCIPKVNYQWLKVYRRSHCGSCGSVVVRVELAGRSTFLCKTCQV